MNKKTTSMFAVLALVAGIFGLFAVNSASAADKATSTQINNVVPAFTTQTAESWTQAYGGTATTDARAESSTTYPTNMGTTLTFTATGDDSNNDNYYMIVCETAGVTANNEAAPSCTGTQICVSSSTTDETASTCTKDTSGLGNETYNWYSYVCDHNAASICSAASTTSQGGTSDETNGSTPAGSPYHVNHVPTFTAGTIVDSGDGSIAPGDTVKFLNSVDADGDTNGTQDTITLYVCSGQTDQGGVTTAFDFRASSCTGGTTLCSQSAVNPSSADATCNDTQTIASVPTAHATDYTVNYYVVDSHGFGTSVEAKDFTVIDVAPVLTSYDTSDSLTIVAGSSDELTYSVSFYDDNGDNDPTSLDFAFFDLDNVTDACTADDNDCIPINSINLASMPSQGCTTSTISAAGTGKTAQGADKDLTVECTFTAWFNANDGANWEVSATPTDGIGAENFTDSGDNNVIAALSGIGVTEASIAYGTVAVGGDSTYGATTQTALENQGNQIIDVLVDGTDMQNVAVDTIVAAQQKWHHTNSSFDWSSGGGNVLVNSATAASDDAAGCLNRDLAVRAVHGTGTENESLAWIIRIPAAQEAGSYTGTNTFETVVNTSCTGTLY